MSISKELFLSILSMDAYNRGYGQGISGLGGVGSGGISFDPKGLQEGFSPALATAVKLNKRPGTLRAVVMTECLGPPRFSVRVPASGHSARSDHFN